MIKIFATGLATTLAVVSLAACSSWMGGPDHAGSTSVAPAVTDANSSTTTKGPPGRGDAPNPPTSTSTAQPH